MILLLCLLVQDFTVLDSGSQRPKVIDPPARFERIVDAGSFKALWELLRPMNGQKELPKVDFAEKIVLLVHPSREADRHSLKIDSAKEEKGVLVVRYSIEQMAIEGGPGWRIPYLLIQVPRSTAPVQFVEVVRKPGTGEALKERIVQKLEGLK